MKSPFDRDFRDPMAGSRATVVSGVRLGFDRPRRTIVARDHLAEHRRFAREVYGRLAPGVPNGEVG